MMMMVLLLWKCLVLYCSVLNYIVLYCIWIVFRIYHCMLKLVDKDLEFSTTCSATTVRFDSASRTQNLVAGQCYMHINAHSTCSQSLVSYSSTPAMIVRVRREREREREMARWRERIMLYLYTIHPVYNNRTITNSVKNISIHINIS